MEEKVFLKFDCLGFIFVLVIVVVLIFVVLAVSVIKWDYSGF